MPCQSHTAWNSSIRRHWSTPMRSTKRAANKGRCCWILPTSARETYLVVGADTIKDVIARPQIYSSRPIGALGVNVYPRAEAYLKEHGFGRTPHLIVMDPPRHTAFRSALGKVLRDKRVHQMRPRSAFP